jgi:hypothetical protein
MPNLIRELNPDGVMGDDNGNVTGVAWLVRGGEVRVVARHRSDWCRREGRTDHEYYARPRVFVSSDTHESIGEHLSNRRNRPQAIYRAAAKDFLGQLDIPLNNFTMAWSPNAGCRQCPCSPGFITKMDGYAKQNLHGINFRGLANGEEFDFERFDIHILMYDAPLTDANRATPRVEVLV